MEVPFQAKHLVGVEYPGTVVNVKKMMEQFGGERKIYNTFCDPSKRMELLFRPGDPYSKPAYGDKFPTNSLVIEVVRKRKKRRGSSAIDDPQVVEESFSVNFLGFVNTVFKFKALCDYQNLPVQYEADGKAESLLPKLLPTGLLPPSWLEEDVPLFVVPLLYSRFDCVQNFYTEGIKLSKKSADPEKDTLIGTSRKKRPTYAMYMTFDSQDSCDEPPKKAVEMLGFYPQQLVLKEKINKLYEERPIWSKAAIVSKLNSGNQNIRLALTATAYRFMNGPWRSLWVRFGYDPRKEPKSKIYQLMDFRIKSSIKLDILDSSRVKAFDYYMLPMRSQKQVSKTPLLNMGHLQPEQDDDADKEGSAKLPSYILPAGQMPTMRQCYYQLCDVYIDEVQRLVHQNDGKEQFCHEKDGWCDIGVMEKCRDIISKQLETISLRSQKKD